MTVGAGKPASSSHSKVMNQAAAVASVSRTKKLVTCLARRFCGLGITRLATLATLMAVRTRTTKYRTSTTAATVVVLMAVRTRTTMYRTSTTAATVVVLMAVRTRTTMYRTSTTAATVVVLMAVSTRTSRPRTLAVAVAKLAAVATRTDAPEVTAAAAEATLAAISPRTVSTTLGHIFTSRVPFLAYASTQPTIRPERTWPTSPGLSDHPRVSFPFLEDAKRCDTSRNSEGDCPV